MIKLLHTADIHAKKSRAKDVIRLIDTMIEDVDKDNFDAVLISGDFWDCAVVNNSAFAEIIARMAVLISKIKVYMIYGTPHHEIANSLEVFKQLGAFVTDKPTVWTLANRFKSTEKVDILGIPEPRKSLLLGSNAETVLHLSFHLAGTLCEDAAEKSRHGAQLPRIHHLVGCHRPAADLLAPLALSELVPVVAPAGRSGAAHRFFPEIRPPAVRTGTAAFRGRVGRTDLFADRWPLPAAAGRSPGSFRCVLSLPDPVFSR